MSLPWFLSLDGRAGYPEAPGHPEPPAFTPRSTPPTGALLFDTKEGTFERIEAALKDGEDRTDFVREAVERELARRLKKAGKS